MKLVIQIPAYNEEANIGAVLEDIKKTFISVDEIDVVVLDDFSNDNTVNIASKYDTKIISFKKHQGLSNIFKYGIQYALSNSADILVNIDGDNQYCANDIEKLIAPILLNEADIVIGSRPIDENENFSLIKKIFQKFGSNITSFVSRIKVKDAASGFRALNRDAMLNINIFNPFTYTIEMLIQAYIKNLTVQNVDINVKYQKNRKSKLFKNELDYVFKQAKNLIRFFIIYRPARFFSILGSAFLLFGSLIGVRFLLYRTGHIQSLILCAIILILSFILFLLAIIGDLFSINRKLLEEIRYEIRSKKYKK